MSPDTATFFADSFAEARRKFAAALQDRKVELETFLHPQRDAMGEPLSIDAALLGSASADALLIVTSGTHGVEGFAGSGFQCALLADDDMLDRISKARVALLLIHAVNPYGFSNLRRANEDNVDINRNFIDFSEPPPDDSDYESLHDLLLPAMWPPGTENVKALTARQQEMGAAVFQAALTRGQRSRPTGLFYAGSGPTWSNLTIRKLVSRHGAQRGHIAWIDVHTGLGRFGHGEKIFAGRNDAHDLARSRAWWGADVVSLYGNGGESASAEVKGPMVLSIYEACPQAAISALGLEFGTLPMPTVLEALRADHWLHLHPDAPTDMARQIRRQLRSAFYVDCDLWKGMILGQARTAVLQATLALGARAS